MLRFLHESPSLNRLKRDAVCDGMHSGLVQSVDEDLKFWDTDEQTPAELSQYKDALPDKAPKEAPTDCCTTGSTQVQVVQDEVGVAELVEAVDDAISEAAVHAGLTNIESRLLQIDDRIHEAATALAKADESATDTADLNVVALVPPDQQFMRFAAWRRGKSLHFSTISNRLC